jgi:glycosyltransferase involved in cell wall biosynthesis
VSEATDTVPVVNGRFLRGAGSSASGVQRVARGLLDAAREAGMRLEVFAPRPTADPRVDRLSWTPPGPIGERIWEQAILPAAARGRPILSLANTAPLASSRSIVMTHDLAPLAGPQWFTPRGRRHGRLIAASARRASVLLAVSESIRAELIARGKPAGHVFVVRPAVDGRFRPAPPETVARLRERLGLALPYVLLVGWADPRKDAATAVAAHSLVVGEVPHDLVVTGVPRAIFAPVRLPAMESIKRLPAIPDEDLPALLTGAEALLYPSRYEGFGLPPLEAMACGTPALVSDIPVLRESAEGRAEYLPAGDVRAWADGLRAALGGGIRPGAPPSWTWSDAVRSLREALRSAGIA